MLIYLLQLTAVPMLALILRPVAGEKEGSSRVYVILMCLSLLAVSASRAASVGVDTEQFCRAYVRIGLEGNYAFDMERYEPLFTLLCLLLNSMTDNYQVLLVVSSAISLIPVARLIYLKSGDMPLSFFLYITLNLYFSSMNIMRQAIAIGIIALGVPQLLEGKWLRYMILVVLATLFHQSAPTTLLLIPLSKVRFTKRVLVVYLIGAVIVFLLSIPISNFVTGLLRRDALYSDEYMGSNYFGALFQAATALACCLLCANYFAISGRRGKGKPMDSLLLHAMMLWFILSTFAMQVEIVGRLRYYFALFAVLAIPEALDRAPKAERGIVKTVVCAAFLTYFIVICIARPEWYGTIPYSADLERLFALP